MQKDLQDSGVNHKFKIVPSDAPHMRINSLESDDLESENTARDMEMGGDAHEFFETSFNEDKNSISYTKI